VAALTGQYFEMAGRIRQSIIVGRLGGVAGFTAAHRSFEVGLAGTLGAFATGKVVGGPFEILPGLQPP